MFVTPGDADINASIIIQNEPADGHCNLSSIVKPRINTVISKPAYEQCITL